MRRTGAGREATPVNGGILSFSIPQGAPQGHGGGDGGQISVQIAQLGRMHLGSLVILAQIGKLPGGSGRNKLSSDWNEVWTWDRPPPQK